LLSLSTWYTRVENSGVIILSPWVSFILLSYPSPNKRPDLCTLTGHNPGFYLTFLQDITWEHVFTQWGWLIAPYVGSVEQRKKPQPTFYVSVTLWLHSDMHIWVPIFLGALRMLKVCVASIWNFNKGTGLPWSDIKLWGINGPCISLGALILKGLESSH
jgi:hypothetical protein